MNNLRKSFCGLRANLPALPIFNKCTQRRAPNATCTGKLPPILRSNLKLVGEVANAVKCHAMTRCQNINRRWEVFVSTCKVECSERFESASVAFRVLWNLIFGGQTMNYLDLSKKLRESLDIREIGTGVLRGLSRVECEAIKLGRGDRRQSITDAIEQNRQTLLILYYKETMLSRQKKTWTRKLENFTNLDIGLIFPDQNRKELNRVGHCLKIAERELKAFDPETEKLMCKYNEDLIKLEIDIVQKLVGGIINRIIIKDNEHLIRNLVLGIFDRLAEPA